MHGVVVHRVAEGAHLLVPHRGLEGVCLCGLLLAGYESHEFLDLVHREWVDSPGGTAHPEMHRAVLVVHDRIDKLHPIGYDVESDSIRFVSIRLKRSLLASRSRKLHSGLKVGRVAVKESINSIPDSVQFNSKPVSRFPRFDTTEFVAFWEEINNEVDMK